MSKTAIVTGGGYGIGRATTRLLAEAGWSVVVFDRDHDRALETQRLVREAGGTCEVIAGDVTDAAAVQRAADWTAATFDRIDGLVNNAASRHVGNILQITEQQWDETVAVVMKGPFLFAKAVIPHMIAAGGGAIVNVSSGDAFGRKNMIPYAAAKGAINTLTLCLAADHLEDHIRVNAVIPGFTVTGMTEHYPAERLADVGRRAVAARPGQPEDMGFLIRFLLSDEAATITGGLFGGLPLAVR
ncbi:MAG TPA: SDR family oxidoreductase [Chloroflexota bacterium]|jgi:NAD(P)-dependent dehydrogenase (short-subunit alcohol dehydrogenase family)